MPRFAANISTMFTELPFLERIGAARDAGFQAVECQFPYEAPAETIRKRLDAAGLAMVLLNTPPGDFEAGDRGLAGMPGRQEEFRTALDQALAYAKALDCPSIHVMAGMVGTEVRRDACLAVFRANLRFAADLAAKAGCALLVEPLNPVDMPGYLVSTVAQAADILDSVARANVRLQLDLYHVQMTTGNLAATIRAQRLRTGHVQIAGVPGRHEPDMGEIAYPYLFEVLDEVGYMGWVGCEYLPKAGTLEGLGWARRHGVQPRPPAAGVGRAAKSGSDGSADKKAKA